MASEAEVERMVVRLVGDGTKYQAMLRQADVSTRRTAALVTAAGKRIEAVGMRLRTLGAGFRTFGAGMSGMGMKMTMAFTAPLAIIGGLGVRAFARFDKAMIESTSIMKVTTGQTKRMRQAALDLSVGGTITQGPADLAKAYFFLASAGKDAEQSMALLPQVAKFATAGAFDMALATDLLTDAQSALGLSSKNAAEDAVNMARLSDVLVKANTLANASVQQFSTALTSKAGAALKTYNKSVEEGVAVLAAMADQGIKAELAGNALDRIQRLLIQSTQKNQKAHKKYGFSVFDSAGKMRNYADIIKNLEDVTRGMTDETKAATLVALGFKARVQGVILPLLGTSSAIAEYQKKLEGAGGTTADVAEKQMKSFSNQMKVLKNQITVVGIEIGKILAPMLLKVSTLIKGGIKWWNSLSNSMKKTIVIVGLIVGALGPLLFVGGLLISLVGGVIAAIGTLITGLVTVVTTLGWILAPMGIVTAILVAFAAAVGIAGAALLDMIGIGGVFSDLLDKAKGFVRNFQANMKILFVWLKDKWSKFKSFVSGVWTGIKNIVAAVVANIAGSTEGGLNFLRGFFSGIIGFFANLSENIGILWDFIKANWQSLLKDMGNLWVTMQINMISNIGTAIKAIARLWISFSGFFVKILTHLFHKLLPKIGVEGFAKFVASPGMDKVLKFLRNKVLASTSLAGAAIFGGGTLDALIGDLQSDFESTAGADGFGLGALATDAMGIMGDAFAESRGPFEGFESSLGDAPEFNLDTGALGLPQFLFGDTDKTKEEAAEKAKAAANAAVQAALDAGVEDIKAVITYDIKGIDAVEAGSAEAMARVREFMSLKPKAELEGPVEMTEKEKMRAGRAVLASGATVSPMSPMQPGAASLASAAGQAQTGAAPASTALAELQAEFLNMGTSGYAFGDEGSARIQAGITGLTAAMNAEGFGTQWPGGLPVGPTTAPESAANQAVSLGIAAGIARLVELAEEDSEKDTVTVSSAGLD